MEIRKNDYPVTLQAYDIKSDAREEFLAEQVVHNQSEVDRFTSRFNGKLIRAHALRPDEVKQYESTHRHTRRRSTIPAWALFLLLVVLALVIAYFMGWLDPLMNKIDTPVNDPLFIPLNL